MDLMEKQTKQSVKTTRKQYNMTGWIASPGWGFSVTEFTLAELLQRPTYRAFKDGTFCGPALGARLKRPAVRHFGRTFRNQRSKISSVLQSRSIWRVFTYFYGMFAVSLQYLCSILSVRTWTIPIWMSMEMMRHRLGVSLRKTLFERDICQVILDFTEDEDNKSLKKLLLCGLFLQFLPDRHEDFCDLVSVSSVGPKTHGGRKRHCEQGAAPKSIQRVQPIGGDVDS